MSSIRKHQDKRRANRKTVGRARVAARRTAYSQWPFKGPSVSSVRRWLNQGVEEGTIERAGEERTGKPGRPAHLFQLTAEGKERAASHSSVDEQRADLQARKFARMNGVSYDTARAALERAKADR